MRYLPLIAGIVLGAAIGATAGILMTQTEAKVPDSVSNKLAELSTRLDDVQNSVGTDRTGGLEMEVARLRTELSELKGNLLRPVPGSEGVVAGGGAPVDGAGDAAGPEVVDDKLKDTVREMVAETDRKRWETWGNRFAQMRAQREKSMLDTFQEKHGLNSYQRERMDEILAKRRDAIGNFFRTMFSEGSEAPDMTKIRDKMAAVTEDTNQEMKQVLSQDQYDAFVEQESQNRRGPPWMGGGGGSRDR